MAKTKFYYYVVVQSEGQAKFVTKAENATKTAYWNSTEKPLPLARSYAEDLAFCLNLNFFPAFVLQSFYELEEQIFFKERTDEQK